VAARLNGAGVAAVGNLLRLRDFRLLYITRLVSASGDGMFQAALASYVLFNPENATTPAETASALAAVLLPYSLIGPFVGVFLDRWSRQRVLVVGNIIKVALVVAVALLVGAGSEGAFFFVAAVATLGVNRFFLSALSAGLPRVVSEPQLVTANALSTTSGSMATIAGAGIGGLVGFGFDSGHGVGNGVIASIVVLAAIVYGLASLIATAMARETLGPSADERSAALSASIWQSITEVSRDLGRAARHVLAHRRAADALTAISAHRFFYGVATLMIVLLDRNYFTSNATSGLRGLGAAVAATGCGILVAAAITPAATRRFGKRAWITWLLAAAGLGIAAFGLPFQPDLLILGAFVLGISAQGVKISVDTTVQEEIDDVFRGRVFSVYDMLFNVTYVAAAAVTATAVPQSGRSTIVMALLAIGYLVAAVGYSLLSARHRGDAGRSPSEAVIDIAAVDHDGPVIGGFGST
jgi:MFS family permease